jgi:hypothetical protein
MKSTWIASALATCMCLCALLGCLTGCETNSDVSDTDTATGSTLGISPTSVSLTTNDTFELFTAVDGLAPFTWSVSDDTLGTISSTDSNSTDQGRYVTYTPVADAEGINTIQVMDARGDSAHATVLQDYE